MNSAEAHALFFLLPGALTALTGGTLYDRRIVEGLRRQGLPVEVWSLSERFPQPSAADLAETAHILADLPEGALVVVDGLALGAMPQQAKFAADRLALVALVHHPLALETGLAPELQAALRQSESQALGQAKRVVVTSEATAGVLVADYGVAPGRIGVVLPGTDPAPTAVGSKGPALALLCVGSLVPRKGHLDLVAALARLKDLPWHLTCIGSTTRDPAVTRRLEEHIAQEGLEDRVTLAGEKPQAVLQAAYHEADLFVLPSHHEGYGMALAEALAHGLPIVSTTAGAISETVPAEAGLLVPPGDVARLTEALGGLLRNEGLRMQLRGGALQMRGTLPSWDKAAACFAAELAKVPL